MKRALCLLALCLAWLPASASAAGTYKKADPIVSSQDKPALSSSDEAALFKWIAGKTAALRQPFCYRQSYGRGAGYPLTTCDAGQQKNGALCYPDCKPGYGGAGPVCWHTCPSGYTDTGAFCHIDKALTRKGSWECHHRKWGVCWLWVLGCPSGYTNAGAFCALNHPSNPSGWSGDGLDLVKDSYGRGAGYPMKCAAGLEQDAALCYPGCKDKYHGVGPVCWQNCPGDLTACGAGCANSKTSCASSTVNMVLAPAMLVANIVTEGAAGKAAEAGEDAAKAAEEASTLSKMKKTYDTIKAAYKDEIELADAAQKGASIGYTTGQNVNMWVTDAVGDFSAITTQQVVKDLDKAFAGHKDAETWVKRQYAIQNLGLMMKQDLGQTASDALNIVATVDPTGVAAVVAAYANPICASDDKIPSVKILY